MFLMSFSKYSFFFFTWPLLGMSSNDITLIYLAIKFKVKHLVFQLLHLSFFKSKYFHEFMIFKQWMFWSRYHINIFDDFIDFFSGIKCWKRIYWQWCYQWYHHQKQQVLEVQFDEQTDTQPEKCSSKFMSKHQQKSLYLFWE